jgi:alkylated DNA repair dioxygenase AlkB
MYPSPHPQSHGFSNGNRNRNRYQGKKQSPYRSAKQDAQFDYSSSISGNGNDSINNDKMDLQRAAAVLLEWLPSLSPDLCQPCMGILQQRINGLLSGGFGEEKSEFSGHQEHEDISMNGSPASECTQGNRDEDEMNSGKVRFQNSWADMAQEVEEKHELLSDEADPSSTASSSGGKKRDLSRDEREYIRFTQLGRKKDFVCLERINGKPMNILEGLELHTGVFNAAEQRRLVAFIYQLQEQGRKKQFRERTYSEPRKWMRGKGRITIQFGCCYNYAVDKNGNPPGIVRDEEVDPLPPLFKAAIRRMVRWHVLPPSCIPDSCIVNIYDEGDCIPPHIDHHDFVRPFCTVSLLSECNIIFGSNLKILGPGEFAGSTAIPLPMGSVLILNGNGADVAKHSVPAVPCKRISITFRKMDHSKMPYEFLPEPDLQNIQPLSYIKKNIHNQSHSSQPSVSGEMILEGGGETSTSPFSMNAVDFPPLHGSHSGNRQHGKSRPLRQ